MPGDKPRAVLLDTHAFLWSILAPEKLSKIARRWLQRLDVRLHVSVASLWEISLKSAKGRLHAPDSVIDGQIADLGILPLSISLAHVRALSTLPFSSTHKDPFDRLIAAQAITEQLPLITADTAFRQYRQVSVIW